MMRALQNLPEALEVEKDTAAMPSGSDGAYTECQHFIIAPGNGILACGM